MIARLVAPPATPIVPNPFDVDNPEVDDYVDTFATRSRGFFDRALWRGSRYLTSMTDILAREGLPTQLAYLPLIESGYQSHAVSRAGATGPWQFIRATGERYGLRIDSLVDERRDPIKSTEAAVRYLKDLHAMFGDWELSLAAYNVGEGRVAKLIERRGVNDYWTMRRFLPRETSEYVPKFLAAVRIAQAPGEYGFESPILSLYEHETVRLERDLPLRTAAAFAGVPKAELVALNPALKRDLSPRGYDLRVPMGSAEPLRQALARYARSEQPERHAIAAAAPSCTATRC
jgi:membrane-bound lytic murein transglycosylase D